MLPTVRRPRGQVPQPRKRSGVADADCPGPGRFCEVQTPPFPSPPGLLKYARIVPLYCFCFNFSPNWLSFLNFTHPDNISADFGGGFDDPGFAVAPPEGTLDGRSPASLRSVHRTPRASPIATGGWARARDVPILPIGLQGAPTLGNHETGPRLASKGLESWAPLTSFHRLMPGAPGHRRPSNVAADSDRGIVPIPQAVRSERRQDAPIFPTGGMGCPTREAKSIHSDDRPSFPYERNHTSRNGMPS
jgi:hypothetical protein